MRRILLGSTAPIGAGVAMASQPAVAADGIKLGVGGYFRTAYMVVFDDDSEGEPGNERNTDGVFSDAEIHFTGSTVLDNGLEVGARVELEGEDNSGDGGDQIDEAWIYFSGGFGELRVGSIDDALGTMCVFAPGGTTNFSAYSPNQWGANTLLQLDLLRCRRCRRFAEVPLSLADLLRLPARAVVRAVERQGDARRRRRPASRHAGQCR